MAKEAPSSPGDQQTAVIALADGTLGVSNVAPVPRPGDDEMLVSVVAVSLNPFDTKMQGPMASPGAIAGADLAGIVVAVGPYAASQYNWAPGDRVCAFVTGMHSLTPDVGAFAQFVTVCAHSCLRVPQSMSLEEAATLGVVVSAAGLALFRSLEIPGYPKTPSPGSNDDLTDRYIQEVPKEKYCILVYGASSAVGTLAVQLAKLSGMKVLATCSPRNFELVKSYGADTVFDYRSKRCVSDIRAATNNRLKFALDCISEDETMEFCYGCLGRTGGRYVRLEPFPAALHTRPSVRPDWVLGSLVHGKTVGWPDPMSRAADPDIKAWAIGWYATVQSLVDAGKLRAHPFSVLEGWSALLDGLQLVKEGLVSGQKLVVRLAG